MNERKRIMARTRKQQLSFEPLEHRLPLDGDPEVLPRANNDSASVAPNSQAGVLIDVLQNDLPNPGAQVILLSFEQPPNGTVTRNDNGTPGNLTDDRMMYVPNPNFVGTDTFTYAINDTLGQGDNSHATVTLSVSQPVLGRQLFYNESGTASPLRYDGNNAAINANDDLAIAMDKSAYLPGSGASTFANVSSYTKGINGVMIDIGGSRAAVTASDFILNLGNTNSTSSWAAAPTPVVSVRPGAGVSGSDRIVLVWANGAITNTWLQVIVKANANTGLAHKPGYPFPPGQGDVFYFGHALGDTGAGNTATQANVSVTDELGARNHPASLFSNIPITNPYDFNRDAQVNSTDSLVARNNPTSIGNVTRFITVANPPTSPEADTASDDGSVASSLTAPSVSGTPASSALPRWLGRRLYEINLPPAPTAKYFENLASEKTSQVRKYSVRAHQVADRLVSDSDLLDDLLMDFYLE